MPRYAFQCEECQYIMDRDYRLTEVRPECLSCEACGKNSNYLLIPPLPMLKSTLDGQKRKGYQDLKEASKLNVLASRTDDPKEKAALKNEMKKTRVTFEKE